MKCTTGDVLFYNKKAYDNHNMYHKPDDLYVTSEEQRLQTVSRVDQDFDIRRVIQPVDKYMAKVRPTMSPKRKSRDASAVKPTLSTLNSLYRVLAISISGCEGKITWAETQF